MRPNGTHGRAVTSTMLPLASAATIPRADRGQPDWTPAFAGATESAVRYGSCGRQHQTVVQAETRHFLLVRDGAELVRHKRLALLAADDLDLNAAQIDRLGRASRRAARRSATGEDKRLLRPCVSIKAG